MSPRRSHVSEGQEIAYAIADIWRALRALQAVDGTQLARTVQEVRDLIVIVNERLADIPEEVQAALDLLGVYTMAQTDNLIANPPGNVSVAGQVTSQAPLKSPGSHDYIVTTDYVAGWINSDGTLGTSPSSRTVKKNLTPMDEESPAGVDAVTALLSLVPYWGHYSWDDDGSPLKVFLIAEEVAAAGFGPDVAPVKDGDAYTVNYSQLVVPLIAALQQERAERLALQARVETLETN